MPSIINTAMLNAFLDEYIDFRTRTTWNTWTGSSVYALKKISSLASSSSTINVDDKARRTAECTTLKNRFETVEKFEDWVDVIDEIAVLARKAQSEKTAEGDSEFARTLDAVRTLIIASILNSPQHQPLYLAKIETIKSERTKLEGEIKDIQSTMVLKIRQRIDITSLEKKSDSLKEELNKKYQLLLDMQDPDTIIDARITKHFVKETLPKKEEIPNLPFSQTINPNVPLSYHLNFFNIFYTQRIDGNRERKLFFHQQMRSPSSHAEPQGVDIMDPAFSQQVDESFLRLSSMQDFTQLFNKTVAMVAAPFIAAPSAVESVPNAQDSPADNSENPVPEANPSNTDDKVKVADAPASSIAPTEPAAPSSDAVSVAKLGQFAPPLPVSGEAAPSENQDLPKKQTAAGKGHKKN